MVRIHTISRAIPNFDSNDRKTDMDRNDFSNYETRNLDFNSKENIMASFISFRRATRILAFFLVLLTGVVLAVPAQAGLVVGNPGDSVSSSDTDGDGVADELDNCIDIPNAGALACDTDLDGYGNACDADFNNDGVSDGLDYASPHFMSDFMTGSESSNVSGLAQGTDMNCDGAVDGLDFVPPYFLTSFGAGIPGPSGLSCAGTVPCPLEYEGEALVDGLVDTTDLEGTSEGFGEYAGPPVDGGESEADRVTVDPVGFEDVPENPAEALDQFEVPADQAQAIGQLELDSSIPMQLRFSPRFRVPASLTGSWSTVAGPPDIRAMDFVLRNAQAFRIDPSTDALQVTEVRDRLQGGSRVRLAQTYHGLPVSGAELVVLLDEGGRVHSVRGTFVPGTSVSPAPAVLDAQAIGIAHQDLNLLHGEEDISVVGAPDLEVHNSGVTRRFEAAHERLVWSVELQLQESETHWTYLVDAHDGSIIRRDDGHQSAHPDKIWDGRNDTKKSNDVLWFVDSVNQRGGATPPSDVAALELHGETYTDYLFNRFGINSIDDNGKRLRGVVNFTHVDSDGIPAPNAAWYSWGKKVRFDPGFVSQDLVAHEYSHGLIQLLTPNGLKYEGQSGALNESFADVMAEYMDCRMTTSSACNWQLTRTLANGTTRVFRSLSNPPGRGDPDHMNGFLLTSSDNGGVHTNSGIPNKMAFLLANGAAGGSFKGVPINGIGLSTAEQLVFDAYVETGLSKTADFLEYRDALIDTARPMLSSAQLKEVCEVTRAVGLGGLTQDFGGTLVEEDDRMGWALAKGDFNTDGFEDVAVGMPYEDIGSVKDAGAVLVFFGSPIGACEAGAEFLTQRHAGATSEKEDHFGKALATGDIDGDGFDDLVVSVPDENLDTGKDVGMFVVFYGSSDGLLSSGVADSEVLTQSRVGNTPSKNDHFGHALATGDFNGDGFDDVLVGSPDEDPYGVEDAGIVTVLYGGTQGLMSSVGNDVKMERLSQKSAGATNETGDRFGYSVTSGDVNGDGYDDGIVGVPYEGLMATSGGVASEAGYMVVLLGGPRGLRDGGSANAERLTQSAAGARVETGDWFGWAVASGDLDGDGFDDVAVSAPYEDDGFTDSGLVVVFYGSASGLIQSGSVRVERFGQRAIPGNFEIWSDRFGLSLAVGNSDGDSFEDLLVGTPYKLLGTTGTVHLLRGSTDGLFSSGTPSADTIQQRQMGGVVAAYDRFGHAMVMADMNGNGREEIVVGAPYADRPGAEDTGMVLIQEK